MLDGEGEGYCVRNGIIYFVKGRFNNGRPVGNCVFYRLNVLNKDLRHTDVHVGSFNSDGFAQVTKSDEVGKTFYVNNSFNFVEIKWFLSKSEYNLNLSRFGRWQVRKLKSISDNETALAVSPYVVYIISATYYPMNPSEANGATNSDSLNLEYYINIQADCKGLTQNGKQSVLEHMKGFVPLTDQLIKVYNAQDINNPIKNLKAHYNVDAANKITAINNILKAVPQADSIYKANPNISDKIEIGRTLYKLYEILEMDYTNTYNNFNNLLSSSFMEEKAEDATKILDAIMNNPLFPRKDQATANVVKTKLKLMVDSYAQAWSKANEVESAKRASLDAQNKKIDELVETYDIPKITYREHKFGENSHTIYYGFEDGILGHVSSENENLWTVYRSKAGHISEDTYKTLDDAVCALYFWEKYGKIRRKGRL